MWRCTRPPRPVLAPWVFGLGLTVASGACASIPTSRVPDDPGTLFSGYEETFGAAVDTCRRVRTLEVALAINARTGDSTVRGNVLGALARPASVRLIGIAPLGAPAFELVASADEAVLVLPRDQRYVRHSSAAELLQTLAGLPLEPADLRAVLTGCVESGSSPVGGRLHRNGWIGIDLAARGPLDKAPGRLYVETVDGERRVVALTRPGLTVEYFDHVRGLPRRLQARVSDRGLTTVLTATLSQVNINVELHPEVFETQIRDDYVPLTFEQFLDSLRTSPSPLEEAPPASAPSR